MLDQYEKGEIVRLLENEMQYLVDNNYEEQEIQWYELLIEKVKEM